MKKKSELKVEVWRSDIVESFHSVDAVVVDQKGQVMSAWGEVERLTYARSSIKPIQAYAFVESGALKKYQLPTEYVALACASHMGEQIHTQKVESWLRSLSLNEPDLECGAHRPFAEYQSDELIRQGIAPTRLHNNCSGKHCGLMSYALAMGHSVHGYSQYRHPVQKYLRKLLSEICQWDYENASWGVDGCGIPTYAVPLVSIARGMSSLLSSRGGLITASMVQFPELVSGPKSFCTDVIKVSQGRSIIKGGAEGVYTALIPSQGLSVALKVHDGAARAAQVAMGYLLKEFSGLLPEHIEALHLHLEPTVKNWSGQVTGRIMTHPTLNG